MDGRARPEWPKSNLSRRGSRSGPYFGETDLCFERRGAAGDATPLRQDAVLSAASPALRAAAAAATDLMSQTPLHVAQSEEVPPLL